MQNPSVIRYYNELVAAGRVNTPSMKEAVKDFARANAYLLIG